MTQKFTDKFLAGLEHLVNTGRINLLSTQLVEQLMTAAKTQSARDVARVEYFRRRRAAAASMARIRRG